MILRGTAFLIGTRPSEFEKVRVREAAAQFAARRQHLAQPDENARRAPQAGTAKREGAAHGGGRGCTGCWAYKIRAWTSIGIIVRRCCRRSGAKAKNGSRALACCSWGVGRWGV